jgi:hypothetical protein
MKNGEPKPSELSSSCSRRLTHVHLNHSDHSEDQHSHHEPQEGQPKEVSMTQEQQDKQRKSEQPRQKKIARGQHHEDSLIMNIIKSIHQSDRGDEQAIGHGEAQTHHETESGSRKFDDA